jgi:hypothetical protein
MKEEYLGYLFPVLIALSALFSLVAVCHYRYLNRPSNLPKIVEHYKLFSKSLTRNIIELNRGLEGLRRFTEYNSPELRDFPVEQHRQYVLEKRKELKRLYGDLKVIHLFYFRTISMSPQLFDFQSLYKAYGDAIADCNKTLLLVHVVTEYLRNQPEV